MNRKNGVISPVHWKFLIVLLFTAAGCAFIQDSLQKLAGQPTEAGPTASMVLERTQTAIPPTGTPILPTLPSQLASTEVHQPAELLDLISAMEWTYSGGYTSLQPPVSGDLQVSSTFTLAASDIPAPASCLERPDCRSEVTLELSNRLQAFSCRQSEQVLWGDYCAEVSIPAGEKFRLRGILYDTHPAQWNYMPILQILPASDVPCLDGEFRCAADLTCYAGYDDYCRSCLGLVKERCACQSPEGALPDGSKCEYWQSGDVIISGKCQSGVCQ